MNNEEKILQMLTELSEGQLEMRSDIGQINRRLDAVEKAMATKENLADAKVLMEAYFDPKFALLADELKLVQEKMLPAEALDDVEDRLDVLEAVVRRHSREIEKLKKAQ